MQIKTQNKLYTYSNKIPTLDDNDYSNSSEESEHSNTPNGERKQLGNHILSNHSLLGLLEIPN